MPFIPSFSLSEVWIDSVAKLIISSFLSANFSCYPNYIFSTLDHRKSGVINFEVIIQTLPSID